MKEDRYFDMVVGDGCSGGKGEMERGGLVSTRLFMTTSTITAVSVTIHARSKGLSARPFARINSLNL